MRTRFAPSPTGMLHVGGLRTALFSYLLAKQTGGTFLVRIEDTDRAREVPGAIDQIMRSLAWMGIVPDEGVVPMLGGWQERGAHGPYCQSHRLELYAPAVEQLVQQGDAYPCFCTPDRLAAMRQLQQEQHKAPMYDRHCLSLPANEVQERLAAGEPHVIRMKVPRGRHVRFDDDIRGEVSFATDTLDDQVLRKSDGWPTYHLAHVVDDHAMDITMVIRGEEWLPSLPKHILLFEMLGWQPPRYAHVPLLLNHDKTKLSKRQQAVSAEEYMQKGYLPEALCNFIAMLGWNPGTEQELFTLDELIQAFSLDRVQKSGAVFDTEKLDWLQGQWIRRLSLEEFSTRIKPAVETAFPAAAHDPSFALKASLIQERITFFHEAPEMLGYFYVRPTPDVLLMANAKQKVQAEDLPDILAHLEHILSAVSDDAWTDQELLSACRQFLLQSEYKLGQLLWPLRALLTGRAYSPGAVEVAAVLGKEETLSRLRIAQQHC